MMRVPVMAYQGHQARGLVPAFVLNLVRFFRFPFLPSNLPSCIGVLPNVAAVAQLSSSSSFSVNQPSFLYFGSSSCSTSSRASASSCARPLPGSCSTGPSQRRRLASPTTSKPIIGFIAEHITATCVRYSFSTKLTTISHVQSERAATHLQVCCKFVH